MKKGFRIIMMMIAVTSILLLTGCFEKDEKIIYKITFDTDGGSTVPVQEVNAGSLATKPTDPTKDGYNFDGWEYEGVDFDFTATITKDMTLKAKWAKIVARYTVTFDTDGGSTVYSVNINEGESLSKPLDPTKDGYIFKNWTLNGVEYDFNSKITSNIELKAVWEAGDATKQTYTVTFDSDGGSVVEEQKVAYKEKAKEPTAPTKSGYVFLDWTYGNKVYNFATKVTGNITLKATWAKEGNYTVSFDVNGSNDTIANQTVAAGNKVKKPLDPTRTGYSFKEWQLNGKTYDFATKVSSDMTLKAVWEAPKVTVTFDSDGGSAVSTQSVEINKTATRPSNPSKTGHIFKGWFLGTTEYDFATPVTANITLVAKWEPVKYTITFDSNGGSSVPSQLVEYGKAVTEPTAPTKSGYTFKEWQLNGKTYVFGTKVTGTMTLKAVWEQEVQKTYTFDYVSIEQDNLDNNGLSGTGDVTIRIYENNVRITTFKSIRIGNYVSSNPTVNIIDIKDKNSIIVILNNDTEVTATRKS